MRFKIGDKVWFWVLKGKVQQGTITATIAFKSNKEETNYYLINDESSSEVAFQKDNSIVECYIFKTKKECIYSFRSWMDLTPIRSIL